MRSISDKINAPCTPYVHGYARVTTGGCFRWRQVLLAGILLWGSALHAQAPRWSLNDCIARALKENISLNQIIANNEVNRISYTQARAARLPNLNLTDAQAFNSGRSINPYTNQYSTQDVSSNSIALNSSVTLFNGFKYTNLIEQYRLSYEAGNLDVAKAKNDLALNVIAAYMQVLFYYESVNAAQAQIEATQAQLGYTRQYVKAGSLPESNLVQVRARLASDKATKVEAENQLQLAKVTLMQLMELPVPPGFDIEQPDLKELSPDVTATPADMYNSAAGLLPEVQSAHIKIRAAETALKVSRAGLLPRLTLTGNLSTSYSSLASRVSYQAVTTTTHIGYLAGNPAEIVDGPVSTTVTNSSGYPFASQLGDNFGQGISLNLSVPIFNNLNYKSDIRKSEVNVRVTQLNEKLVKNQLRKNIETAYTDQTAAAKNYIATKEQLLSEELAYRNSAVKYRAGAINTTDFFVEKSTYDRAVIAHLQAKYQYLYKTRVVNFYLNGSISN